MRRRTRGTTTAQLCALVALPLLLVACSGGDEATGGPTPAATTTLTAEDAPRAGGKVGDVVTTVDGTADALSPSSTPSATGTPAPQAAAAADKLEADVAADAALSSADGGEDYADYVLRTHSTAGFSYEAPVEWADLRETQNSIGNTLVATPSYDGWKGGTDVAGISVNRSVDAAADPAAILSTRRSFWYGPNCTSGEVRPYADGRFVGVAQTFTGCGGAGTATLVAVRAVDAAVPFAAVLDMTLVDRRDAAALARVVSSLTYT